MKKEMEEQLGLPSDCMIQRLLFLFFVWFRELKEEKEGKKKGKEGCNKRERTF